MGMVINTQLNTSLTTQFKNPPTQGRVFLFTSFFPLSSLCFLTCIPLSILTGQYRPLFVRFMGEELRERSTDCNFMPGANGSVKELQWSYLISAFSVFKHLYHHHSLVDWHSLGRVQGNCSMGTFISIISLFNPEDTD